MPESSQQRDLIDRIIAIEEGMMHSEHLLEKLNLVICGVQDQLDEQKRQLELLQKAVKNFQSDEPEERSAEDERPPHY